MLTLIEKRTDKICEKWSLNECIYMLCSKEDQYILLEQKEINISRTTFIERMMYCVNKEQIGRAHV